MLKQTKFIQLQVGLILSFKLTNLQLQVLKSRILFFFFFGLKYNNMITDPRHNYMIITIIGTHRESTSKHSPDWSSHGREERTHTKEGQPPTQSGTTPMFLNRPWKICIILCTHQVLDLGGGGFPNEGPPLWQGTMCKSKKA